MKSVFAGVFILFFSLAGNAQEWPRQKPIQFVVGFGPGATTDTVARIAALGLESRQNSPADFAAFLREEVPKWSKAVKDSGAKAD